VAPVGEKEVYVARAMANISPFQSNAGHFRRRDGDQIAVTT
jgi:hypothetical protein